MAMAEFNKEGDVNSQRPSVCEFESFFYKGRRAETDEFTISFEVACDAIKLVFYTKATPGEA